MYETVNMYHFTFKRDQKEKEKFSWSSQCHCHCKLQLQVTNGFMKLDFKWFGIIKNYFGYLRGHYFDNSAFHRNRRKEKIANKAKQNKEALCFIDFATRCKHGNKYVGYYTYNQHCLNWLDGKIEELEAIRPGNIYSQRAKKLQETCIIQ